MMDPWRELDILVAEKVMGFVPVKPGEPPHSGWRNAKGYWFPLESYPDTPGVPHFSTSIRDAWEVVEHFRSKEWGEKHGYYDVWISAAGGNYPYWCAEKRDAKNTVEIFINTGAKHREIARGESDISVPHAICLAALEAVR